MTVEFTPFRKIPRLRRNIVISEKLDGCVRPGAKITMADGTKKAIRDVRVGDEVLGVDGGGSIVPTPVLRTFDNGRKSEWVKVKGARTGLGRGGREFAVITTPNHRYLQPNGEYASANSLAPGDVVLAHHNDLSLTLPERYRGGKGWAPTPPGDPYRMTTRWLTVDSVSPWTPTNGNSERALDIETGTHNYFVHGILTHNSNAAVVVAPVSDLRDVSGPTVAVVGSGDDLYAIYAQSRTRFITPEADNFGFARWVQENAEKLKDVLGEGVHFGELWGSKIQRGYGRTSANGNHDRTFSLFNTARWGIQDGNPILGETAIDHAAGAVGLDGIGVVPVLYRGPWSDVAVEESLEALRQEGSFAPEALGFRNPEGVVVYHEAARTYAKVLLENDDIPKGLGLA